MSRAGRRKQQVVPAVDVSARDHLSPQVLDRPARIGQHMFQRAEGRRHSFAFGFVAQVQYAADQ
jgi:hypothetical protein